MRARLVSVACVLAGAVIAAGGAGAGGVPGGDRSSVTEAFVTDQTGDLLSIVELSTLKVAQTLKIGGKPAGIAMSGDGKRAFITAPEGKELIVVDAVTRQIVKRIKVGNGPLGVAAHPTNGRVYVADWYQHEIYVVDPVAGAAVAPNWCRQVAVRPRGYARRLPPAERRSRQQRGVVHRYGDQHAPRHGDGRTAPLRHHHRSRGSARLRCQRRQRRRERDRHREPQSGRHGASWKAPLCGRARRGARVRDQPVRCNGERHRLGRASR